MQLQTKTIFQNIKKILNFKYNFVHLYCSILTTKQIYEHCSFFKIKNEHFIHFFLQITINISK